MLTVVHLYSDGLSGCPLFPELYAAGMHLGTYTGGATYFNHGDWQGTERMRTNINGFPTEMCTNEPFGDAQFCQGNETSHHHFTGKERDTETGFDYFGARYYAGGLGHWMSPDWDAKPVSVPYAHFGNPQSLNLYAYVGNNPLSTVDPDGHDQPLLHGTTCGTTPFCSGRGPFYGDMWIKVDPICNFDPVRCGLSSLSLAGSMFAMAAGETDAKAALMEAPEAQAGSNAARTDPAPAALSAGAGAEPLIAQQPQDATTSQGPFKAKDPEKYMGTEVGSGHCVDFVKADTDVPRQTKDWAPGDRVSETTPSGAAIATFGPDGRYQNESGESHAAELVSVAPGAQSAVVRDQWKSHPVNTRTIEDRGGRGKPVNDLSRYRVIMRREEERDQ
jgi:RHS repeat-associated protein